jgi:fructose-1,6-bisphosphatase/inositol monophosphatase family enzyme
VLDQVADLMREVAATVVLPRFRHLRESEVHVKSPGDVVTVADQEAERALTIGLTGLLPGSGVVGEEAVAADPAVLSHVGDRGAVWIVDPVDGTNNFAAGKTPFAVMVALLRDGEPAASWILDVVDDRMTVAEAGSGAYIDGVRVKTRTDNPGAAALHGVVAHKYLPAGLRAQSSANGHRLGGVTAGQHCAGYEYPAVATDEQQFALFWRILPWDHLPGTLILREAGGTILHLDGSDYHPTDSERGLLVAPNPEIWETVSTTLFPR